VAEPGAGKREAENGKRWENEAESTRRVPGSSARRARAAGARRRASLRRGDETRPTDLVPGISPQVPGHQLRPHEGVDRIEGRRSATEDPELDRPRGRRKEERVDPVDVGLDELPRARRKTFPRRLGGAPEARKREKHERRDRRAREHGKRDENLFQAGATARKGTFERESSLGRLLRERLRERARDRTSRRRTRGSGRPRQRRSAPETGR